MREAFELHWPKLKKAIKRYGPTHTKEDVWALIESNKAQFWAGKNSAIVTETVNWPTGFKELRGWLAAGDLGEIEQMVPFIEDWARHDGFNRVVMVPRPGFKVPFARQGYRQTMIVLQKDL